MITWIISQIPWWVYVIVAAPFVGAAFYFFGPLIMGVWAILPKPVKWLLGGIVAGLLAFVAGMNKSSRAAKERQKQLEQQAVNKRNEIHENVENRSESDIDKSFDKWVR
jgi:hypothetical protein